jgi:NAD(P)-dependent dehydrogenase (short-subunit alcohol dehydrogenase family)
MIDRVAADEALERIAAVGRAGHCSYLQADVTDRRAIEAALRAVDPLDVAIGNAGIVESAPFLEVTAELWQAHLDVNPTGCFHVGQAAAQLMVERDRPGLVLFTGSWVGEIPWPEIGPYCVSKAGLRTRAFDGARARGAPDPRQRRGTGDRACRHGASPVRDRPRARAARVRRHTAG